MVLPTESASLGTEQVEGEREPIRVQTEDRELRIPRGRFKKLRLCSVKDLPKVDLLLSNGTGT